MFWCCWIFLTMDIHYFVWQTGLLWNIKHPVFREGRRWKQLYLLCSLRVFPKQPKAPARFCPGDPTSTNRASSLWRWLWQHAYLHSHLAEGGPFCLSPACLSPACLSQLLSYCCSNQPGPLRGPRRQLGTRGLRHCWECPHGKPAGEEGWQVSSISLLFPAGIGENLWCFISFLREAQLWWWPKHNLDIIIDL